MALTKGWPEPTEPDWSTAEKREKPEGVNVRRMKNTKRAPRMRRWDVEKSNGKRRNDVEEKEGQNRKERERNKERNSETTSESHHSQQTGNTAAALRRTIKAAWSWMKTRQEEKKCCWKLPSVVQINYLIKHIVTSHLNKVCTHLMSLSNSLRQQLRLTHTQRGKQRKCTDFYTCINV